MPAAHRCGFRIRRRPNATQSVPPSQTKTLSILTRMQSQSQSLLLSRPSDAQQSVGTRLSHTLVPYTPPHLHSCLSLLVISITALVEAGNSFIGSGISITNTITTTSYQAHLLPSSLTLEGGTLVLAPSSRDQQATTSLCSAPSYTILARSRCISSRKTSSSILHRLTRSTPAMTRRFVVSLRSSAPASVTSKASRSFCKGFRL